METKEKRKYCVPIARTGCVFVAAETEEVGDFLVATQCVLRRSAKTVGAVIAKMKELEKR